MDIQKNKKKSTSSNYKGTVPNTPEGLEFIKNMRKLGLRLKLHGRHTNRKGLIGKVKSIEHSWIDSNGNKRTVKPYNKTHREIRHDVPIKFAERIAIYVY